MIGKRSKVDFSAHEIFPIVKDGDSLITFRFANPKTIRHSITFINTCGILAVTGDCGNWIFCRSFIPSKDGYVSEGYWCEKIKINSTQNPTIFDRDGTKKVICEMLEDEENKDEEEYLKGLLEKVDDGEFWYRYWASDNLPEGRDYEFIPERRELDPCLSVIFDAFDEVCRRLGNKDT